MNINQLKRVRKAFRSYAPEYQRVYMRKWVASVRTLGNKWLLSQPLDRVNA